MLEGIERKAGGGGGGGGREGDPGSNANIFSDPPFGGESDSDANGFCGVAFGVPVDSVLFDIVCIGGNDVDAVERGDGNCADCCC